MSCYEWISLNNIIHFLFKGKLPQIVQIVQIIFFQVASYPEQIIKVTTRIHSNRIRIAYFGGRPHPPASANEVADW